jgi:ligand-binding SRPBCC domain-containing protein
VATGAHMIPREKVPIDAAFEITTALGAPAEEVWSGAVDPDGVNYELGPWVSMTMPKSIEPGMTIDDVELAVPLGRSWIRFGRVPVDYDDLCLVERGPGMRFLERSKLGSARLWQHERQVVPTGESSCELTDRVAIELRSPLRAIGGARLAPRIMRRLFEHRHRRLLERWDAV